MKIKNKVINVLMKSAFAVGLILCMIFNCFSTFDYLKQTKAKASSNSTVFGDNYEVISNIKWSRTQDYYGNKCDNPVNNTLLNNGSGYKNAYKSDDKFNTTDYWTKEDGNTYDLNKKNGDPKNGILWMPDWFPASNKEQYNVKFDYDTLLYYLNPTQTTNVWDGKTSDIYAQDRVQKIKNVNSGNIPSNFPNFATWGYCAYGNDARYGDQLRLFRGEFELSEDDLKDSDFFITTGDNQDLILPIDDTMIVLVDGEPTGINFTSSVAGVNENKSITIHNGSKLGDDGKGNYNIKLKLTSCTDAGNGDRGYKADCTDSRHAALSAFTDGLHAHLDMVENGKILGDITNILDNNSISLNSNSKYNHKIEILCSDFYLSGGMTQLQLIKVKKPRVKTTKEAYFDNGTGSKLVATGTSDGSNDVPGTVTGQGKLYYDLTYSNVGVTDVKNVVFNDTDLGVTVSKDGLYVNGTKINNPDTLTITKGSVTKTGSESLSLLESLKSGESIKVSDKTYLYKNVTGNETNVLSNTVKVNSNYLVSSNTEESKATVDVNVKEDVNLSINKTINSVTRDGKEVYNKTQNKELPRIYPGDKITFALAITNSGKTNALKLSLKDILSKDDNSKIFKDSNWTFFDANKDKVNGDNFEVKAGKTLNITTDEWIVPNDARYILNNKVELYKDSKFVTDDNVKFTVYPRIYINMKCSDDKNKHFYVKVVGTNSDGYNVFTTSMYLKDGDRVEIDNLDFNVNYEVVETIPMNFTLEGIDINNKDSVPNNLKFDLMTIDHPSEVTLYNSKRESKSFKDDDEVTNDLDNIHFK